MRLKEKKILKKFATILKKFSAQGAKKVDYGRPKNSHSLIRKNSQKASIPVKQLSLTEFQAFVNKSVVKCKHAQKPNIPNLSKC